MGYYTTDDGVLKYKGRIYVGEDPKFRKKLMESFFSSSIGGHFGRRASYHRIKKVLAKT